MMWFCGSSSRSPDQDKDKNGDGAVMDKFELLLFFSCSMVPSLATPPANAARDNLVYLPNVCYLECLYKDSADASKSRKLS